MEAPSRTIQPSGGRPQERGPSRTHAPQVDDDAGEPGAHDDTPRPPNFIERIRGSVGDRVQDTSLRSVAREIGMTPTGLKKFLMGAAPYTPTLRRLRAWYSRYGGVQRNDLNADEAQAALLVLVHELEPDARDAAMESMLRCMEDGYRRSGRESPEWMGELRARVLAEG